MSRLLAWFTRIAGPAAVMAAASLGAGAASSLILAGAWFRYELLWAALLVLPFLVIAVDSASRIGLLNKDRGMFSLICEHIHPSAGWLLLIIMVPVHLFICMGQMSVMTSAALSLFNYHPPASAAALAESRYQAVEMILSLVLAAGVLWLMASEGYQRMQKFMTAFMLLMFACFLIVAARGFQELGAILAGFAPSIPADLPVPAQGAARDSGVSILAIIGSVLAPAAMLGIPYMSADNRQAGAVDLRREFRQSVVHLGFFYGASSICVIIAGGFALYPLAHHGEIDSVHEASRVLLRAFPQGLEFLGPLVFSAGMVIAGLTTFVVTVEVISYFMLDMFGCDWRHRKDNKRFRIMVGVFVIIPALLAPLWTFPALFKLLLLMGVNAIVAPLAFVAVIVIANKKSVMGEHASGWARNVLLAGGLALVFVVSAFKLPDWFHALAG